MIHDFIVIFTFNHIILEHMLKTFFKACCSQLYFISKNLCIFLVVVAKVIDNLEL